MIKLLWLLALATVAWRLILGRWPWDTFRRLRAHPDAQRARALLGLAEGASREEIIEAHRRLVAQVHPDRGGTSEQVHEANAARDLLLGELALGKPR